jgi:hypothetical protein
MKPKLFVSCFRNMAKDGRNELIAAPEAPPLAEQVIDITAKSIAGDPFPQYTTFICVKAEADCSLAFGLDPEADPEFHLVEAGERLYYGVQEGHRVAVIEVLL